MAREHARLWLDINSDDEFESLPFDAQGFYTRVILTLPDLSYAGVADWRPRKLTTKAPDLTYERIITAAAHLEADRYCLFDLDTEEVLARSFIRRDELLRNPKMAAAVVKAYHGIASKMLRAAVITEIRRVRDEHPEYSSWSAKDKTTDIGAELSKLMTKPGLDEVPYVPQIQPIITNGHPVSITNNKTVDIGNPDTVQNTKPIGNGESVRIPSTYTSTPTPAPLEGYVSTEGHQAADPDTDTLPPEPFCKRHPGGTNQACRACADAKNRRKTYDREHDLAQAAAQAQFWTEVENCPNCDDKGWLENTDDEPATRCPQHDWQHTHA